LFVCPLGTCLILVGVAVTAGWDAKPLAIKSLLCACFILLTSPVGAHALARGAHRSGVPLCPQSVIDAYADVPRPARTEQAVGTSSAAPQESYDAKAQTA
jgi:multisubunit Na+/H+ antiporter MnhG subunit